MTMVKGKLARLLYSALIILMVVSMLVTGCGGKGIENGFDISDECAIPRYQSAYKSVTNKFNINDVTLEFYYGGVFTDYLEHERENASNYPTFEIYFMNDEEDKILIRTVEENLISEKYRCTPKKNIFGYTIGVDFSHSEVLTIPKELFTKKSGKVCFAIYAEDINAIVPTIDFITGKNIYYKIEGDNVILSSNK